MPVTLEDKILSASEARGQFFKVLDEVRSGRCVIIHQPKHEDVTIVPRTFIARLLLEMEELLSQLESLELAADEGAMEAIRRSESDIKASRTVALRDAGRYLKERKHRGKR